MNATVDITNSCADNWAPTQKQCEDWLNCGLQVAQRNKPCCISLSFVDATSSQSLNNNYRGKDKPTNVLSFPMVQPDLLATISQNSDDGEVLLVADTVPPTPEEGVSVGMELRLPQQELMVEQTVGVAVSAMM